MSAAKMPVLRLRERQPLACSDKQSQEEETAASLEDSLDLLKKVTFDSQKEEFVGLPEPWKQLLIISNISKEEQREDPQAVLNSLKLYTRLVKKRPSFAKFMIITPENETGRGHADVDEVDALFRRRETYVRKTDTEVYEALRSLATRGDIKDKYEIQKQLGFGATGVVSLAKCKTSGKLVAIKVMEVRRQTRKDCLLTEIETMKKLKHDNIVNFIDCYFNEHELSLIMEYLDGGPLTDIVEKFVMDENQIAAVCIQCLQGLEYLHQKHIIHRDIKSDNVLMGVSGVVKLTDFGFCAQLSSVRGERQTMVGTLRWMAPEVAREDPYSTKSDIWSFGIMVFEMLEGTPPNVHYHDIRALIYIKNVGKPRLKDEGSLSPELKQFYNMCLEFDAKKRADTKQLLRHPFLRKAVPHSFLQDLVKAAHQEVNKGARS